jgi:hypothetical protein
MVEVAATAKPTAAGRGLASWWARLPPRRRPVPPSTAPPVAG